MRAAAILLFAAVVPTAACAHGDGIEIGEDSVRIPPDAVEESADRAEDAVDAEATVRLLAADGEVVGDADLATVDDLLRLEIEIRPPEGASGWRAFVVRGDCAVPTGRVVQASAFAADGDGFESVTTFPEAWLETGTRYAVQVLDGEGRTAACGEIGEVRPRLPPG